MKRRLSAFSCKQLQDVPGQGLTHFESFFPEKASLSFQSRSKCPSIQFEEYAVAVKHLSVFSRCDTTGYFIFESTPIDVAAKVQPDLPKKLWARLQRLLILRNVSTCPNPLAGAQKICSSVHLPSLQGTNPVTQNISKTKRPFGVACSRIFAIHPVTQV